MSHTPTKRVPGSTYRLQFNAGFTFQHAARICTYLGDLGITDCYASPLFRAGPESTHGYDICDFNELSPALGGAEGFNRFYESRRASGLGLLLDMVPNHMGNDLSNAQWSDVLENGRASAFADWFDINWAPARPDLQDKVLLPVLEDHYGKVLENGKLKLKLRLDKSGLAAGYYDRLIPISPQSTSGVLQKAAAAATPQHAPWREKLRQIAEQLGRTQPHNIAALSDSKKQLAGLLADSEAARNAVEETLIHLNGKSGEPASFDELDAILRQQHYRLAFWRVGPEEINYRRFFEVTELASLRMESAEVVKATHDLLFRLVREGRVTGLRIDHPDGLRDPRTYFERLQSHQPVYVVVEKILTGDEPLPDDWPVEGTTGYEFLNRLNGVFVDASSRSRIDYLYREFTRCTDEFSSLAREGKRWMLSHSLISELNSLVRRLNHICAQTRRGYDFSERMLRAAIIEVMAAFPVYRTYINEQTAKPTDLEAGYIRIAIKEARHADKKLDQAVLDFLEDLLLLNFPGEGSTLDSDCREFVMRFQQLSGPVMAKGLEDTAFYRFHRLVSLNEVGGEPSEFGCSVEAFHKHNTEQARRWPHTLLSSATHDTKRGEDVRSRINVISELPEAWRDAVTAWSALNARHKTKLPGGAAPDANDEYLFYQVLAGCWLEEQRHSDDPESMSARMSAYMLKALKESKLHATWTDPNPEYEDATSRFVKAVLSPESAEFLAAFRSFQRHLAYFGVFNSLSQTLLKLTSPGVPDTYQGTELWDFSLVDPDNRRQVDYNLRRNLLTDLTSRCPGDVDVRGQVAELLAHPESGQIKLYVIWRALQTRNARRGIFDHGDYVPFSTAGDDAEHVITFGRRSTDGTALVIVPRLTLKLMAGRQRPPIGPDVWRGTRIRVPGAPTRFRNVMTNEILTVGDGKDTLLVGQALSSFPVALLVSE